MKETIEQLASRILRRHDREDLRLGCDHYFSFPHHQQPSWWTFEFSAEHSDAVGVYENRPSTPNDAVIFRLSGVTVLSQQVFSFGYVDILGIGQVPKEGEVCGVYIRLRNGVEVFLPVLNQGGEVFTIVRFLYQARTAME